MSCCIHAAVHRAGPSKIALMLDVSRDLVYCLKKNYNFEGPEEEREAFIVKRKRREAPRPVRDDEFVAIVKAKVEENPGVSMHAIRRELSVSARTVRRAVHEDLGLKSYALRRAQLLTQK